MDQADNIRLAENWLKTMIDLHLKKKKKVKQTLCVSGDINRKYTIWPINSSCQQITHNLIKSLDFTTKENGGYMT